VVVNTSRDPECQEFRADMTDFLAGLITKKLICRIFPDEFQPVERFPSSGFGRPATPEKLSMW
jgi:hypothetical protein